MTEAISALEDECIQGYRDGRDLDAPDPSSNRHPAYIHGFLCGRDDILVSNGTRAMPLRTAQQARDTWALILSSLGGDP